MSLRYDMLLLSSSPSSIKTWRFNSFDGSNNKHQLINVLLRHYDKSQLEIKIIISHVFLPSFVGCCRLGCGQNSNKNYNNDNNNNNNNIYNEKIKNKQLSTVFFLVLIYFGFINYQILADVVQPWLLVILVYQSVLGALITEVKEIKFVSKMFNLL